MKKSLFSIIGLVLVIGLALLIMTSIFAAGGKWVNAQRVPLYPVSGGSSDNVLTSEPSQGEVVFVDPMGKVTFIIQVNVEGLTPNYEYAVWIRNLSGEYTGSYTYFHQPLGYYRVGTFTTNDEGKGKYHLNILSEELTPGEYFIQLAINDECVIIGSTVLATEKYIVVTIKE